MPAKRKSKKGIAIQTDLNRPNENAVEDLSCTTIKVTLYDENTDLIIFYIFVDLYSEAGDLSIAASFFPKY
jgi:hypothetical protein